MRPLYEITKEYRFLIEMSDDPSISETAFADTLEMLHGELEDKIEGCVTVAAAIESDIAGIAKEIDRLTKMKAMLEGRVSRIKGAVWKAMEATGERKVKTEHYAVSIAPNGGLAPLKITGEVPAEFCDLVPNKTKIREALKGGELGFASLMPRGEHLSIR